MLDNHQWQVKFEEGFAAAIGINRTKVDEEGSLTLYLQDAARIDLLRCAEALDNAAD